MRSSSAAVVLSLFLVGIADAALGSPPPGTVLNQNTVFDADVDASGWTGVVYPIGADNITIDGAGHRILASDASAVFDFSNRTGVHITNFRIEATKTAIQASGASTSTVDTCTIAGSPATALSMWSADEIRIANVTALNRV